MELTNYTDGFMAHIPAKEIDIVENMIKEYPEVVTYLIGIEKEPYEHMHFVITHTNPKFYHKFSKKLFKDKYNLKGKWYKIDGKTYPRQYGKIKEVNDYEKLCSYCVKDGNIRSNMPQNELDDFVKKSYKKSELEGYYMQILQKLNDFDKKNQQDYARSQKQIVDEKIMTNKILETTEQMYKRIDQYEKSRERNIKIYIIKLLKEKKIDCITKGRIDNIFNRWITASWSDQEIYNHFYSYN